MGFKRMRLKFSTNSIRWLRRRMNRTWCTLTSTTPILTDLHLAINTPITARQLAEEVGNRKKTLGRRTRTSSSKCFTKEFKRAAMYWCRRRTIAWRWQRRPKWIWTECRKTLKNVVPIKRCVKKRLKQTEKLRNSKVARLPLSWWQKRRSVQLKRSNLKQYRCRLVKRFLQLKKRKRQESWRNS